MIFDEIILENFGVYKGRHAIALAPRTPDKSIILFGGLNGGGKTTLLDAFRLVFHGKLARCASRNGLGYTDFLRRSIHRDADPSEGAAVELRFRTHAEGQEFAYSVRRTWRSNGPASVKESVEVRRDGEPDSVLTDAWADHAEELIPSSICPLFFFDGEKIEEFADLENSGNLLSTAIHSLLGLDVVNRLMTDLTVIERRNGSYAKSAPQREKVKTLVAEVRKLQGQRATLTQEQAHLRNQIDKETRTIEKLEERFQKEGGDLYERRHELEREYQDCVCAHREVEDQLRRLAAGAAPFLLVQDLLKRTHAQSQQEHEAEQQKALHQAITKRDARLLEIVRKHRASKALLSAMSEFIKHDNEERSQRSRCKEYLHLRSETREQLRGLLHTELPRASEEISTALAQAERLQRQCEHLERALAGVPRDDAVEPILKERENKQRAIGELETQLHVLEQKVVQISQELDQTKRQLAKVVETSGRAALEHKDARRTIIHARKAQDTLRLFRERVVQNHVGRLERFILEGYQSLLRKKALVTAVRVDPQTFSVSLYDRAHNLLPSDRLSAGERQLFAVAMLWGLARASGRPLPAIIDTPLGRLDSTHRLYLVERYFPCASHQVLLLSTDEEVDEDYYAQLKPRVGRTYTLDYDEESDSTRVSPGYFWD